MSVLTEFSQKILILKIFCEYFLFDDW